MQVSYSTAPTYKRDSNGSVRIWWAEVGTDGTNWAWRTQSGLQTGKITTSKWKSVDQKNVGRSNETSLEQQAIFEVNSTRQRRLERGSFENLSDVDTPSVQTKPMLASGYDGVVFNFDKTVYYSQPKLDGIRCIARKDGLWTRAGKEIVSVPHIKEALAEFFDKNPDAILDGELYNHKLRDDFNTITSVVRKTKPKPEDIAKAKDLVQYHVYDVIHLSDTKFSDRIQWFNDQSLSDPIIPVETSLVTSQDQIDRNYGDYLQDGFEGQMIRIDLPYEIDKRSKSLIKRKEFLTDEFNVVSVEEGKGNWSGHVKRFILELPNGTQFGAGVRGKQDILKDLFESNKTPNWVTLRYFTPTPDGIPRFPVVIDWGMGNRED